MCAPPLRLLCKVAQASLGSRHRDGSYAWAGGVGGSDAACGIARVAEAVARALESSAASREAPCTALVELRARCAHEAHTARQVPTLGATTHTSAIVAHKS